jgi:serine/threonine protein phosphatase 1
VKLRFTEPAPAEASVPAGLAVYAIGDVHGRCDLLEPLLDAIASRGGQKRIVYLGDYVSRGVDSRRVLELVRSCVAAVTLKGNHEDLLLRYVDGDLSAGRHWFDFGGLDCLASWGITGADQSVDDRKLETLRLQFREALPPDDLAFFRGLQASHTEGGYRFVHAGVRPGVPLAEQSDHEQMWIRKPFLDSTRDHGAVVVHGHCIAPEVQVRKNRIGIDTGAYKSGILTCLVLEGATRALIQTVPG